MTVMTMQMMRSDEYLIKCAEKRMESYMRTADKTAHKISDVYQNALRELKRPLESIFKGLSVGISNAEVKRILNVVDNTDIDEFFKKAVENISDLDTKQIMQNEFKRPAIKAKVNQIKSLSEKIKATCKAVIESTTKLTDDCLSELIPYAYYHSAYDKQHSSGIGMFLPLLTEERIDEIRLTNWSGIRYAERIRNNGIRLVDLLTAEVLSGFLTKKSQARMAEIMTQRMSEAFNRSYTLLRTEACFVTNQAELRSYVDNAVQKYRYVAVLDMRTSKMCRLLDGQEFDVDKAIVGINFPPLHPHCRSTTRPVINGEDLSEQERNAIDPETGEDMTVPADMTYGEWYEKYVDKSTESGIIKKHSKKVTETAVNDVHSIGKIDIEKYKCITNDITTDEVIITDERIQHIKDRHPNDYERFYKYMSEVVREPEYIVEANKPNTALILKSFSNGEEQFKTVLRLVTSTDNNGFKNSIITFMKINDSEWKRLIKNKKILYKKE